MTPSEPSHSAFSTATTREQDLGRDHGVDKTERSSLYPAPQSATATTALPWDTAFWSGE
jgi:hypothetical protein